MKNFTFPATQITFTCSKSAIKILKKGEIWSKIKTLLTCSSVFIVNIEHISHLFLVFLLLTLIK